MSAPLKRPPFGERLIASLASGLEAIKRDATLRTTFVAAIPDPPRFDRKRLVALRERHHMSQSSFADFLNVSSKTVESWEQGVRKPNGAALRLLQVLEDPSCLSGMGGGRRSRRVAG